MLKNILVNVCFVNRRLITRNMFYDNENDITEYDRNESTIIEFNRKKKST